LTRTSGPRLIARAWEAALGGGVGFGVGLGHQRPRRRDGHDGALRGTQPPLRRAGQQEGGGQVGVENLAPFGQGEQAQRLAHYDAGVRHKRVEALEFVGDGSDRAPDGLFVRDVALDQNDVTHISVVAALEPRSRQIDHADAPSRLQQLT